MLKYGTDLLCNSFVMRVIPTFKAKFNINKGVTFSRCFQYQNQDKFINWGTGLHKVKSFSV